MLKPMQSQDFLVVTGLISARRSRICGTATPQARPCRICKAAPRECPMEWVSECRYNPYSGIHRIMSPQKPCVLTVFIFFLDLYSVSCLILRHLRINLCTEGKKCQLRNLKMLQAKGDSDNCNAATHTPHNGSDRHRQSRHNKPDNI